jgi:hypothetical protein
MHSHYNNKIGIPVCGSSNVRVICNTQQAKPSLALTSAVLGFRLRSTTKAALGYSQVRRVILTLADTLVVQSIGAAASSLFPCPSALHRAPRGQISCYNVEFPSLAPKRGNLRALGNELHSKAQTGRTTAPDHPFMNAPHLYDALKRMNFPFHRLKPSETLTILLQWYITRTVAF